MAAALKAALASVVGGAGAAAAAASGLVVAHCDPVAGVAVVRCARDHLPQVAGGVGGRVSARACERRWRGFCWQTPGPARRPLLDSEPPPTPFTPSIIHPQVRAALALVADVDRRAARTTTIGVFGRASNARRAAARAADCVPPVGASQVKARAEARRRLETAEL